MKIRIYYRTNDLKTPIRSTKEATLRGEILLVVIEGNDGWNLLEHGNAVGVLASKSAEFELTEENLAKYMESADRVNMETIKEVER
jgi:hypothetical protein